ncbi:putative HYDROLASE domain protein [Mycobacterium ulcerans str. Harvey]|uniref:HYDROLASE domain protein n=1 Tax=Mycobacterium ulcerans str. Harvey TaxID=1299332 RepID=A0ABN0QT73_MYCUL|nr:putative HYDROLASE domain protein [Mycobacterium ulcerans str. Harvey]
MLVASFINPHDVVLFPAWVRFGPLKPSHLDPHMCRHHPPPTRT